ncbi:MAG: hypothetical protein GWP47_09510 [Actinobacteria bacterium]|nr:hypothetical protein [Actinomycetota bacterium]
MSHDPLRGEFERMAPPQVSPAEARDRLGALLPEYRTARRNHRIRTGVAGVTAAIALTVGGSVAIAAIAPGSSAPETKFASPGESTDDSIGNEGADGASDEAVTTNSSSSSEDAPDDATETAEHADSTLGQDSRDDDPIDDGADDSDSESDDGADDSDSESDDTGEAVVEGETYSRSGPGGMLSVRVVGGVLQLVEAVPASGFNADVTELDDEVRADFSAGSDEYRVEAEYEDDQLFWTVDS